MKKVFVIGMGEVGRRLAAAFDAGGLEVEPVTRSEGWHAARSDEPGARIVCVREDDLEAALAELGKVPGERLVVVQNGWIRPLLASRGTVTRGLIWFTAKGDFFRELRPSPFSGPLAIPLVEALARGGISAAAFSAPIFDALEAEKMAFNCVVGLPLAVHRLSLGEYLDQRGDEARAVFTEAAEVCARAAGTRPDGSWWQEFVDSVEELHWIRASTAKALGFRNRAVVRLAHAHELECPHNESLLAAYEGRS